MRSSKFLRFSFLGVLLVSPGMADEIDKVHEEALRVLHEKTGQSATAATPAATVNNTPSAAPKTSSTMQDVDRSRAEREERIKAEAQQRMVEREKLQEQRRQQFEQYVKERERLRQQQRTFDENAARQTGQIKQTGVEDIHAQALEALHQAQAQPAAVVPAVSQPALEPASKPAPLVTPSNPAPTRAPGPTSVPSTSVQPGSGPTGAVGSAPAANDEVASRALQIIREKNSQAAANAAPSSSARLSEAEVAPRVTASSSSARLMAQNTDEVHQKALEVLHQQTQAGVSTAPASSTSPTPSPELQQRLKEMQAELNSTQPQGGSASSPFSDAYVRELEQRARENAQQAGSIAATPAPSAPLDAKAREMLRRQDAELAHKSGSAPIVASHSSTTSQVYLRPGLTPEEEAQAREILRQSAGATSQPIMASPSLSVAPQAAVMATPAPTVAAAPVAATPAPVAIPEATSVQYSKELEDRAREIIRQRAQSQQSGQPSVTSAPTPVPTVTSAPVVAGSTGQVNNVSTVQTPVTAPSTEVHTQALQALEQMPKTREQRLKELTDLYRADRMGPAEYHQRRAQILAEPK